MNMKLICINCDHWRLRAGPPRRGARSAVTLLELVIASTMLAVVMTSLSLVLRTARTVWEANDNDYAALHQAQTVARHFVREAREATSVISLPSSGSTITLRMRDGSQLTWSHFGSVGELKDVVMLASSSTGQQMPLAYDIRELSFRGFEADGVTAATDVDRIRLVEIGVTVVLPRGANPRQTVASKVWIRSW